MVVEQLPSFGRRPRLRLRDVECRLIGVSFLLSPMNYAKIHAKVFNAPVLDGRIITHTISGWKWLNKCTGNHQDAVPIKRFGIGVRDIQMRISGIWVFWAHLCILSELILIIECVLSQTARPLRNSLSEQGISRSAWRSRKGRPHPQLCQYKPMVLVSDKPSSSMGIW